MLKEVNLRNVTGLNDVMFKGIMYRNEKVLSKVLEQALEEKITKIKYLNNELTPISFIEKGKRLDLYIEDSDSYVDIEVTNNYQISIKNRNISFGCRIYVDTVIKGVGYEEYKKVKVINLIGNKRSSEAKRTGYLTDQNGDIMSEMLLYSEIYIDNLVLMYYNKNEQEINKNKYLIMLGLNLNELIKFNKEYGDEIVEEYLREFEEVAIIEEFEPLFDKEEDERRMRYSIRLAGLREGLEKGIKQGTKDGIKKGIEQGINQGERNKQIEIAKKMLAKNMLLEDITETTGLSIEEINNLR